MAQTNSSSPVQPLSVGDVVSASIKLYRSHLKSYLGIAAVAVLWILLPLVALIPILFLIVGAIEAESFNPIVPLLLAAWVVLLLYGLTRYLANSALISRLVFGELANQPESVQTARRYTHARKWNFLWLSVLVGLLFSAIVLATYLVMFLLIALAAAVFGSGAAAEGGVALVILGAVLGLILVCAVVFLFSWASARLAINELPLAVEDGVGATASIGRSWKLTKDSALRILLILLVAFLITIPVQAIAQIGILLIQAVLGTQLTQNSPLYTSLTLLLGYILGFATSILIIPFWQAIKAVIYYDLRSRREGLGLTLRDRGGKEISD